MLHKEKEIFMFKKMMIALMCVGGLIALSACSSVQIATTLNNQKLTVGEGTSMGHINGEIWGVYLFNVPLVSGSSTKPGNPVYFTDTVKVDSVVNMLTRKAGDFFESTAITDLTTKRSSTWISPFLVLWVDSVQASANVIK